MWAIQISFYAFDGGSGGGGGGGICENTEYS